MSVRRVGPGTDKLVATLDGLDNLEGKVGWFESAHYPGGTPVAYVATIQEFGYAAGGIPARPFMRPAVADNGPEWMKLLGEGAQAAMEGRFTPRAVLEMVVLKAAGDVGKKIAAVTSPALSPRTIAARKNKSTKPLVDTGQMIQSVTGKVEDAGS